VKATSVAAWTPPKAIVRPCTSSALGARPETLAGLSGLGPAVAVRVEHHAAAHGLDHARIVVRLGCFSREPFVYGRLRRTRRRL